MSFFVLADGQQRLEVILGPFFCFGVVADVKKFMKWCFVHLIDSFQRKNRINTSGVREKLQEIPEYECI
jgi:hypothetical protein